MRVEIIADREQWNRFVEAQSAGNVAQTFEWGELGHHLSSDVLRLGALTDDGELCGTSGREKRPGGAAPSC